MSSELTKHYELKATDERRLEQRLDTLRRAIRAQNGLVVEVRRSQMGPCGPHLASVRYSIPALMSA